MFGFLHVNDNLIEIYIIFFISSFLRKKTSKIPASDFSYNLMALSKIIEIQAIKS